MIKHEVTVAKILYASRLTKRKYRKLLALAKFLRDCRNKVSEYLYNNIELLFDMSMKDFVKHLILINQIVKRKQLRLLDQQTLMLKN